MPHPLRDRLTGPALLRLLGGIGEAFGDGNFRRYSVGSIVSWLSFFVQAVAVSWSAWEMTHSTRWLAAVALMDAVPNVALMPFGGVLADRYDRFRMLLIAYGLATLQAACLAGLAFSGHLTIDRLAAMAVLHGAIHAFSIPAAYGFLPRFVERRRLASAISVSAAYTQMGIFVGPALAGWVILHFGTAVAFASNVVGYGIYFLCVSSLRTPEGYHMPARSGKSFIADLVDGLRAILGHRGITAILAFMLFGDALTAAVRQMAPAFSDKALGAGVEGLSTLLACAGIGATLSALWLAQGGARRCTPEIIVWAFLGFVVAVIGLMLTHHLAWAGLAMVAIGCFFEVCRTGTLALLQNAVPDHLRGRVMSTQFLLTRLAGAIGVASVGTAAEVLGLRGPILALAVLALLAWAGIIGRRRRIGAAFSSGA